MATPNMNLSLPTVSSTLGPLWATQLNAALTLVDSHDHSSGNGVKVTTAGLNINADLTLNSFNATNVRTARFTSQGAPLALATDLSCLYASLGNLYYNDGVGNQIRLTVNGALDTASSGSITGMGATTASVTYSNVTKIFTFLQATGVPGKLNTGSILMSPDASTTNAITLTSSASLAASYTLTLPAALPAATKIVTVDSSGNLGFVYDVDSSTLEVAANVLRIKDNGVTTAKIAAGAVTQAKRAALGQQVSLSSSGFSTTSATYVDVTNLTVTITTTGRPVMLMMIADGGTDTYILPPPNTASAFVAFLEDGVAISQQEFVVAPASTSRFGLNPYMVSVPSAGSHTYKVQAKVASGQTFNVVGYKLVAFEL